jgi:xanthine dehydrogenase small subunit
MQIAASPNALTLGAAITYSQALPQLENYFPAFGALVRRIGSRQIRNLGTFAGNLATASPIGDTLPCLIVLGAQVTLHSTKGARALAVEDFILGYRKTALAADEVISAIRIPALPAGETFAAYKLSKRFDQDISTVIAAFRLRRDGAKVAQLRAVYGGMAATAARAKCVEDALAGKAWTAETMAALDALIARDFSPMTDQRGTASYRLRAAANLLRRFQIESTDARVPVRVETL